MKYFALLTVSLMILSGCADEETPTDAVTQRVVPLDTLETAIIIGTDIGDSTDTFGSIMDVQVDDMGNIIVLDRVAADLKMYSASGEYVMHIARRGNGPGELYLPWDMFLMNDGRLMVMDPGRSGFVVFDDSLGFLEGLELWQQNPPFQSCAVSDSQFAAYKANLDITDTDLTIHRRVALYTYGREDWDLLFWRDSLSFPINDVREDRSLLFHNIEEPLTICGNGDGNVFFSLKSGEEYSVTGWNIDGDEVLDISMDLVPVEKSPEELAAESTYVTNYLSRMSDSPFEFHPEPYKYMIVDIGMGPDGNLWVRRGNTRNPFFDIFDPISGELLSQAVFPDDGWSWKTEVSGNGIVAWEEDPPSGYQVLHVLE